MWCIGTMNAEYIARMELSNLVGFGNNLKIAIKRRGMRQKDIADAALISLPTLRKALKGDPTVSIGVYLATLSQLQLDEQIATLVEPSSDEIGKALAERNLPHESELNGLNMIFNK